MTAGRRLVRALPIGVVVAIDAMVTSSPSIAALLAIVLLLSLVLGPRWAPGPLAHRTMTALLPVIGFALGAALNVHTSAPSVVGEAWAAIAAGALLLAASRLLVRGAPLGYKGTIVLGLAAMVACGQTRTNGAYAIAVAAFIATALVALRSEDEGRPPPAAWSGRVRTAAILAGALAAAVAAALVTSLPKVHDWVQARFDAMYTSYLARTGFTDRLHLGHMRQMLQSDDIVLRVRGAASVHGGIPDTPDYLRGAVYDFYYFGTWAQATKDEPREIATPIGPPDDASAYSEVRRVSGPTDRLFLPLDTRTLMTVHGKARANANGVWFRGPDDAGDVVWFAPGPRGGLAAVAPPSQYDLRIVTDVADEATLKDIARAWTAGASTDLEKVLAIGEHLRQGYTYSLHYARTPGRDQVVDFLLVHKEGHCEYFASAMALLAREVGVPARVVAGYRVAERSRLSDYWLVRERNAHAWVEAWIEGKGWVSVDATPPSEVPLNQPHDSSVVAALGDLLRLWKDATLEWISGLSTLQLVALSAAGILLYGVYYWLQQRRKRTRAAAIDPLAPAPPLPCFDAFTAALAQHGLTRAPSEPLERFATRLDEQGSALLAAYAALRYGGVGEAVEIDQAMRAYAEKIHKEGTRK